MPVATIKYYLREQLLPPGDATAPNQADYHDVHVRRLRLVRALREVGGLGIEAVREVVQAIQDPDLPIHEVLGVAHRAVSPFEPDAVPELELAEIDDLLRRLGWEIDPNAPDRHGLARTLSSLRSLGYASDPNGFLPYAEAAERIASMEVSGLGSRTSREDAVEYTVVGTVVYGAALLALRRLAQEHLSKRRA